MSRSPRQEFLTQSSMSITKKQSSTDSSDSNPWESLGSPTFLWSPSSGIPLQDGLYMDSRFPVQNMPIQTDVVWKRPKVRRSSRTHLLTVKSVDISSTFSKHAYLNSSACLGVLAMYGYSIWTHCFVVKLQHNLTTNSHEFDA